MSLAQRIRTNLTHALQPQALELIDESAMHAGHAAMKGLAAGETHFRLKIVADAFAGMSRVQRQRQIYSLLAAELADGVHALAITAQTPAEAAIRPDSASG
ncbi:BolA family transcriptional regulator [Ferrovibrio sp.]|uniref:BolA family protein n=1 Tax=Ferrovibrio sp. TaxID=1917215 RepID=UPI00261342DC|nr:BolA family protein [Ferrovibrio sp.]